MRYRRARVDGGASIFTVNLAERHQSLLVEYIDVLRKVVGMVREQHPFTINAMVILPEHLHAVWTLPPGDADFPGRWMLIKAAHGIYPSANAKAPAGCAKENAASGNAVIGNTSSETKKIFPDMLNTSILIQ